MTSINDTAITSRARQLAAIGRDLHARGWVPATSGNFSMRVSDERILLTASGRHKGHLENDDFLVVDLRGQPLTPGKPSAETRLHTQLYAWREQVDTVLHCHSPAATVLSRHWPEASAITLRDYELLKAFPGIDTHAAALAIPIFDNTQDMTRLAQTVEPYLESNPPCPAYLIRGHGLYVWGDSAAGCQRHLEALDFLLQCELLHLQLQR